MGWGDVTAADAFALAMIGVMFLGMGVVSLIFFSIRRSSVSRDPEVEALLEEIGEPEEIPPAEPAEPKRPAASAWERDGDWWKL
jgi:hypothetical protein